MKANVGDWIRFMQQGRLVIGVVAYYEPRRGYSQEPTAITVEHGPVLCADILEVRATPTPETTP